MLTASGLRSPKTSSELHAAAAAEREAAALRRRPRPQARLHHSARRKEKKGQEKEKAQGQAKEEGHPQEHGSSETRHQPTASPCQEQSSHLTWYRKRPCTSIASSCSTSRCSSSNSTSTADSVGAAAAAASTKSIATSDTPRIIHSGRAHVGGERYWSPGRSISAVITSSTTSEPLSTARRSRSEAGTAIAGTKAEHPVKLGSGKTFSEVNFCNLANPSVFFASCSPGTAKIYFPKSALQLLQSKSHFLGPRTQFFFLASEWCFFFFFQQKVVFLPSEPCAHFCQYWA